MNSRAGGGVYFAIEDRNSGGEMKYVFMPFFCVLFISKYRISSQYNHYRPKQLEFWFSRDYSQPEYWQKWNGWKMMRGVVQRYRYSDGSLRTSFCVFWDGILGHHLNKRLESFATCYSQSILLADFKENHTLLWLKKIPYKKFAKQKKSSLFMIAFCRTEK
jgi:hypothetical protein